MKRQDNHCHIKKLTNQTKIKRGSDMVDTLSNGTRIGNALKNIFKEIKTSQVSEQLKELGVDIRNSDNNFKTLEEILTEVSRLADEDMMKVSKIIAGEYNTNHLFTLLRHKNN